MVLIGIDPYPCSQKVDQLLCSSHVFSGRFLAFAKFQPLAWPVEVIVAHLWGCSPAKVRWHVAMDNPPFIEYLDGPWD